MSKFARTSVDFVKLAKKGEPAILTEPQVEGETISLTHDTLNDYRVRVKNYGKWFLPPDTFNRQFDQLKDVVTPEQIEQLLVKRIQEVKQASKRDHTQSNAINSVSYTHQNSFGANRNQANDQVFTGKTFSKGSSKNNVILSQ